MSRRKGRILAFQALYSYDVGGVPLENLLRLEWEETDDSDSGQEKASDTEAFARILISGTIHHIDDVDAVIKNHLSQNWDFSRLNRVSLAILRISVFTLLYQKEIHPTIVIDEAISLSKEYGTDDSFKFINAMLDTIRKELQEAEGKSIENVS